MGLVKPGDGLGLPYPPAWWQRRMCSLDLETTGPDPQRDQIVTAAIAFVGDRQPTDTRTWLADPGVPIPDEAAEIHGVTTERAQAEGRPLVDVVSEVSAMMVWAIANGIPIVGYNIGRFDLTVMARSCERLSVPKPWDAGAPMRVVDPRPLDMFLDRYRPSYVDPDTGRKLDPERAKAMGIPSSRTLEGMCEVYDAVLDGAHDAAFDAIAAARLCYRIGQRGIVRRRVRNKAEDDELYELRETWGRVRNDLDALQDFQRQIIEEDRPRFAAWKRDEAAQLEAAGETERAAESRAMADHIESEHGWPVLDSEPS